MQHIPHRPHIPTHRPTHSGGGGDLGPAGVVIGLIAAAVIVFVFILPSIREHDREWNAIKAESDRKWNEAQERHRNFARDPWGVHDPEEARRREAEWRKQEEERNKFRVRLEEQRQKVQASREGARYRELVTLIQNMERDFGQEANRIGMQDELWQVKVNAFNGCFEISRREAQALVRQDRFQAAQKVIDDMANELRPLAQNTELGGQLSQICEGYRFLSDLAAMAGEGDAR